MKKLSILVPIIGLFAYAVLTGYSSGPGISGVGDLTGASGTAGCSCHNSSSTSSTVVSIELDSLGYQVFKYIGGHSYTIKMTGTQTSGSLTLSHFGFQLSAVSTGTSTNEGTLSAISGTHYGTYGGIHIVEHSSALPTTTGSGGSGSTYVVNIPWTAPTSGTGCVTIFGVLNAVNFNGTDDAGDKWNNTSYTIGEPAADISGTMSVCVGATTTLTDASSCGTWSSGNTSVASIGSTSGTVTGVSAGSAIITFAVGAQNFATATVTVLPAPSNISGTTTVCAGSTTSLTDPSGTGTWASGGSAASVGASTGVVTGISSGTAPVTFTLGTTGCKTTTTVTVNPLPFSIGGPTTACIGATGFLTDGSGSGNWSSSNAAVLGTTGGTVTAVGAGTASISYILSTTGCLISRTETVTPLPAAITGINNICAGLTNTFSDATSGGVWSASGGIASISTTGDVTGLATGTGVISYTLSGAGCVSTTGFTVNPTPFAISGASSVCVSSTTSLSDLSGGGGTWSSSNSSIAAIGLTSGMVSGVAPGTVIITFVLPTGCLTTTPMAVNPLPGAITGTAVVCVGSSSSLSTSGSGSGGTWISSNTSVASIDISSGSMLGTGAGTATISYVLSSGCYSTVTATVNPLPAAISGPTAVCNGSSVSLTDGTGGGSWSSSNISVVTVGTTGLVTSIATGSATISYILPATGCFVTAHETVNALPAAIAGASGVCTGSSTTLTDATGGGTWSSSSTGVATIVSGSGAFTGITAGTAIITYKITATGCLITTVESSNPLPATIGGTLSACVGASTTLSDAVSGGSWISSNGNAVVGSSSGTVTGVTTGTTIITYILPTGCSTKSTFVVRPAPAAIIGAAGVCAGSSVPLTDVSGAGTWSSNNTTVAAIGTSGSLAGLTQGTAGITFTLNATGCSVSRIEVVNALPGAITGTTPICAGQTTTFSDDSLGGTWTTGNASVATVGGSTGIITGVTGGSSLISYTLPTGCYATKVVTINPIAAISGLSSMCSGLHTTLTDAVTGGTWSSGNTAVATIGSGSGFLSGISSGSTIITYSLPTGCFATSVITIVSGPTAITGNTNVCIGTPSLLSDIGGGIWSSSNSTVAVVGTGGVVAGVAAGTSVIDYSLGTGCSVTITVTVNPAAAAITGTSSMCQGSSTPLSDGSIGGSWSTTSSNITVGLTGNVTGIIPGTSIVSYTLPTGCAAGKIVTVNPLPLTVSGPSAVCQGGTIPLSDGLTGGTWTSSATTTASINSVSGLLTGLSAGTTVVSYRLGTGCSITDTITVNPLPGAITGTAHLCNGGTTTLTDGGGGTWSSDGSIASIGTTGIVTGVSPGTVIVTYTLGTGCMAFTMVTVNPNPTVFTVTGGGAFCSGTGGVPVGLSGSQSGVSYQLYNGSSTSGGSVSGTGASFNFGSISAPGTYTVSATSSSTSCGSDMAGSTIVTVNPLPSVITGTPGVCVGSSVTLSDLSSGGSWSLSSGIAAIGTTGALSGISSGTIVVSYTLTTGCFITAVETINPLPASISGSSNVCAGSTLGLTDISGGGTWTSINTTIASIGSGSGIVSGVSGGIDTIVYTLPTGCQITSTINVNPVPAAISGPYAVCAGSSITMTDATSGGTWSSSSTIATAGSSTGTIAGVSAGTAIIYYTLASGCATSTPVTINPLPAAIGGVSLVCDSATLSDASVGGTWTSGTTSVATIGASSGFVTSITAGTVIMSYTLPTTCMITRAINVNFHPSAGTISGITHECGTSTSTLTDGASGGNWSSSNTSVATVGSTGVVTGVATGIATISYAVTNVCGTATVSTPDSVLVIPVVDTILGADSVCAGDSVSLSEVGITGVWSSSNTTVATVSSTGTVTGLAAGTSNISFTVTTECGTVSAALTMHVKSIAVCNEGVKATPAEATFKVYPNPNTGSFIIQAPSLSADGIITINDVSGKIVETRIIVAGSNRSIDFSLPNIAGGSYFIKIVAGEQTYRQVLEVIK